MHYQETKQFVESNLDIKIQWEKWITWLNILRIPAESWDTF